MFSTNSQFSICFFVVIMKRWLLRPNANWCTILMQFRIPWNILMKYLIQICVIINSYPHFYRKRIPPQIAYDFMHISLAYVSNDSIYDVFEFMGFWLPRLHGLIPFPRFPWVLTTTVIFQVFQAVYKPRNRSALSFIYVMKSLISL